MKSGNAKATLADDLPVFNRYQTALYFFIHLSPGNGTKDNNGS